MEPLHPRVWVLTLALAAMSAPAAADVPPPGSEECAGRPVGDACRVGGSEGACQETSCTRLDYSNGTPPTPVSYPCLLCVEGATPTVEPRGGGCAVRPGSSAMPHLGVLAGLLAVGLRRRRA